MATAWNSASDRPNWVRPLMYVAVRSRAPATTPAAVRHRPATYRSASACAPSSPRSSASAPSRTTVWVVIRALVARLEQGDAGVADVDERHHRPVAVQRTDQEPARLGGIGHADLAAGDGAVGVRRGGGGGDRPAGLPQRGRQEERTAGDAREQGLLLLVGAGRGQHEGPAAQRLPDRQVLRTGAGLAEQHAHRGQPEPLAAVRLGDGQPEQTGLGELGPAAVAVEHVGQHRPDRRERLGALGVHLREAVGRHVQNCNVF